MVETMRLGLHFTSFGGASGSREVRSRLGRVASVAEDAGLHSLWVMDQLVQIERFGPPEAPVLEAYTALGWLAARSERLELGVLVSGGPYRDPRLLVKSVTTLDVLSGGRAWLGLGADWNDLRGRDFKLARPPASARYDELRELVEIAGRMFGSDARPYHGGAYDLDSLFNQARTIAASTDPHRRQRDATNATPRRPVCRRL
ncbi:MAG: LLM class flavin-dependent oxidoreductase [Solirubrobacteraceae bacterium]